MRRVHLLYTTILSSTLLLNAGGKSTQPATTKPIEIPNYQSSFYLQGGIGKVYIKDLSTKESFNAPILNLTVGYNINNYISLELRAAHSISTLNYKDSNSHYGHLGTDIKLSLPIQEFTPYIYGGYGISYISHLKGADRKESSPYMGLGASYKIDDSLSASIELFQHYKAKGFDGRATEDTITIRGINLNLTYKF